MTLGRANHVAFVDIATKETVAYILVGNRAWGVDLSRDEKTLFVTNGLSDDMSIIDVDEPEGHQVGPGRARAALGARR